MLLYTNNAQSKHKNRKTIPVMTAYKWMIYLGINLSKDVKNFYSENYKRPLKDIKEGINVWHDKAHVHGLKELILPKCQFCPIWSMDPTQSLSNYSSHFCRNGKADPQIHIEPQGASDSKTILKEKN